MRLVENRLALINLRHHASAHRIFRLQNCALGRRAGYRDRGQVGGCQHGSQWNVLGCRNYLRRRHRLCRRQADAHDAINHPRAESSDHECDEEDR